jgi:hypothetical protein
VSAEDTARQVAAMREELRDAIDAGRLQVEPSESGRLRLSEVTRALLAALSKTGGEHSTVKLTRNAKGDTQIEVSVRTGDSPEVETAADAMAEAVRLYDNLREVYPMNAEPARDSSPAASAAARAAAIATQQGSDG